MDDSHAQLLKLARTHHHAPRVQQEHLVRAMVEPASGQEIQALVLFLVDVLREIGEQGDRRMWPEQCVRFARDAYGRSSWRPLVRPQMPAEGVS